MTDGGPAASPVEPTPAGDDIGASSTPARSATVKWVAAIVAVAAVGLVALFIAADPTAPDVSGPSPLINQPAPAAVGELGDGTPFDLSRRKGSFVVLNFFASDCIPCIREHPDLIEFDDQQSLLGTEGAELYSVVTGDTQSRVEEFFAERGGDWPAVYSEGDQISVVFGVALVPETWIVDPDGIVRARFQNTVTAEQLSITIQQIREAIR